MVLRFDLEVVNGVRAKPEKSTEISAAAESDVVVSTIPGTLKLLAIEDSTI